MTPLLSNQPEIKVGGQCSLTNLTKPKYNQTHLNFPLQNHKVCGTLLSSTNFQHYAFYQKVRNPWKITITTEKHRLLCRFTTNTQPEISAESVSSTRKRLSLTKWISANSIAQWYRLQRHHSVKIKGSRPISTGINLIPQQNHNGISVSKCYDTNALL